MADTRQSIQELDRELRLLRRTQDDYLDAQHQLILSDIPRMQEHHMGDAQMSALLDELSSSARIEMESTLAAMDGRKAELASEIRKQEDAKARQQDRAGR